MAKNVLTVVFVLDESRRDETTSMVNEFFAAMKPSKLPYLVRGISTEDELTILDLYQQRVQDEHGVPDELMEQVRAEVMNG